MPIRVRPYTPELIPAVVAFNQRLRAGGAKYQFPEQHVPGWLPKVDGRKIFQEYFVAVENGTEVRGGFVLKHQEFSLNGDAVSIGTCQLPISEGIVNKAYGSTGVQILLNAFERKPLFYALGIGGYQEPMGVFLSKFGWTLGTVPFFFRICHSFRFLRNIAYLRANRLRKVVADLMAWSGAGWIGLKLLNVVLAKRGPYGRSIRAETVENFGDWADKLWEECKREYALCAVRDGETLNVLYPANDPRFIRLRVSQEGKVIGWAVLLDSQMQGSSYFGDMRVGTVVDCMAARKDAAQVIRAAARHLKSLGVDLIVSNQLDAAWGAALKSQGFLTGPSNFLFAASKQLVERLQPLSTTWNSIHMTRGDGDGPINL